MEVIDAQVISSICVFQDPIIVFVPSQILLVWNSLLWQMLDA